jgi:SAM-dependent methyltransferase
MPPSVKLSQVGIQPGNRQYIDEPAIARNYDASLVDNLVAKFDEAVVEKKLAELSKSIPSAVVADFGCGTGRSLLAAKKAGFFCIGIDLSAPMLEIAAAKLLAEPKSAACQLFKSNLLELDWLQRETIDLALCMFSTFGMIHGRTNRLSFLQTVKNSLTPKGTLLVHGHNVWYQRFFPGGKRWLARSWVRSLFQRGFEFGDRYADNRFVEQLFLHSFTLAGMKNELAAAGFLIENIFPIRDEKQTSTPVGWIVECRKR